MNCAITFEFIRQNFKKRIFLLGKMLFIGKLLFKKKINILQFHEDLNFFLVTSKQSAIIEKANMMFLTKEVTEKNQSLKTQMILATTNQNEKVSIEIVWWKNGFFSDHKADFNTIKKIFPENTLMHANQGNISTVNPIQDWLFRGCSRMGGGPKRTPTSLKFVTNILQWWNLVQLYLT